MLMTWGKVHPLRATNLSGGVHSTRSEGRLGQSTQMLLLGWQSAASIGLSPLTKIYQEVVLAHHF